ncbi:MAG: hypothetical protein J7463_05910 [Roseiflexus sp.]|jgi:hypothetical protein|nr:hypothetical protein [Roseiflexus sp.]
MCDIHFEQYQNVLACGFGTRPYRCSAQGMRLDKGYDDKDVRATLRECGCTAPMHSRNEEAGEIACTASGGQARSELAQSVSPLAGALEEEAQAVSCLPSLRLWLNRLARRRVIRIGSYKLHDDA